jgi:hypothetical protein
LSFTTYPLFLCALTFVYSVNVHNGVYFFQAHFSLMVQGENTLISLWKGGNTYCKIRCTRHYSIQDNTHIKAYHLHYLTEHFKMYFRQIINQNLYIYVYKHKHITPSYYLLSKIFIPGKKRTMMYTGYLGHSDRAANLLS